MSQHQTPAKKSLTGSASPTPKKPLQELSPNRLAQQQQLCLSPASQANAIAQQLVAHTANIAECTCPTCQYYRMAMLFAHSHETQSPPGLVDQYTMYSQMMAAASMSPQQQQQQMMMMQQPQQMMAGSMMMPAPTPLRMGSASNNGFSPRANNNHHNSSSRRGNNYDAGALFNGGAAEAQQQQEGMMGGNQQLPALHDESLLQAFEQACSATGGLAAAACTAGGRSLVQAALRQAKPELTQQVFDGLVTASADAFETVVMDQHGCHAMRSLVECITSEQVTLLVARLHGNLVLNLATYSQYTRRVLQSLFERHPNCNLQPVVEVMGENARYLAATQQGCIAMMRVFEHCGEEQRRQIVEPLLPLFAELSMDPYGNYVVQCVLENTERNLSAQYISTAFQGKFLRMATNKFASNVLEKLLQAGSPAPRKLILDELVFNPAALQQVVQDGFGNFVIQTILETCPTQQEHKRVCDRLKPVVATSPYGHKIEMKMRNNRRFNHNLHRRQRNGASPRNDNGVAVGAM